MDDLQAMHDAVTIGSNHESLTLSIPDPACPVRTLCRPLGGIYGRSLAGLGIRRK